MMGFNACLRRLRACLIGLGMRCSWHPTSLTIAHAEEQFILDVQHKILDIMAERHISQSHLADRLEVSDAQVSQFFSDRPNMTIRQLGRIAYVLDVEFTLATKSDREKRGRL
jgi:DNA-binding Xre family transcriptional regulator